MKRLLDFFLKAFLRLLVYLIQNLTPSLYLLGNKPKADGNGFFYGGVKGGGDFFSLCQ
jgi:hypothetical protein